MANNNYFGKIEDANKTDFHVILKNLKEFKKFESKMVSVGGNRWTISFEKTEISDDEGNPVYYLGIFLVSKVQRNANDWAVLANFKAKLFSNKSMFPRVFDLGPSPYNFIKKKWGEAYWIPWKELMNAENGYVQNDSCQIAIKIIASRMEMKGVKSHMIDFVPIKAFRNDSSEGKFRIKIKQCHQFSGICSPEFTLGNFPWHFLISKYGKSHEKYLRVELFNPSKSSCKITLKCKLISNDPNVADVVDVLENHRLNRSFDYAFDMISWKELCSPEKKFIHDNSFVVEAKLEIIESKGSLKRLASDGNEDVKLKCAHCLANLVVQPKFVLGCGEMFCSDCAKQAQRNKKCPSCNKNLTGCKLIKLQLEK